MSLSSLRPLAIALLVTAGCGDDDGGATADAPATPDARADGAGTPDAAPPDASGGTAWVGDPCTSDGECAGGVCFEDAEGFPGGYCSNETCDVDVPDSCLAFGGDGTCLDRMGTGTCFDRCNDQSDCRTGYVCADPGTNRRVCYPIPVCGNGIVEFGEECDPPGSTNCGVDCIGTGTAPIGDPCTGAQDCLGNWCVTEAAEGFPGGYCAQLDCDLGSPDTSCLAYGGDGVCIDIGETMPFGVCLDGCDPSAAVSECRTGYFCSPGGPAGGVCLAAPECGDGVVDFPEECDPPNGSTCTSSCVGTGTAPIGAACDDAGDCAGNACITEMGAWPMGYCAQAGCNLTIDPVTACAPYGGDGICIDVGDTSPFGACLDQCDGDGDCRTGYYCQVAGPGVHVCAPRPVCGNSTVEFPEECDPPNGTTCTAACVGTGTAAVGEACGSAADCAGDGCFQPTDGFPGGYCTDIDCDLTADPVTACAGAGGDGYCLDLGDGIGFCLDQCGTCRGGYTCTNLGGGVRLCTP